MINSVVKQARRLGFICHINGEKIWQITPPQGKGNWRLEQKDNIWVLSVRGIPQVYLHDAEVLAFLELRYAAMQD